MFLVLLYSEKSSSKCGSFGSPSIDFTALCTHLSCSIDTITLHLLVYMLVSLIWLPLLWIVLNIAHNNCISNGIQKCSILKPEVNANKIYFIVTCQGNTGERHPKNLQWSRMLYFRQYSKLYYFRMERCLRTNNMLNYFMY